MATKYTVTYEDGEWPQIVEWQHNPYLTVQPVGMTLPEARAQLADWAMAQVEHFRMVARSARKARKEDIKAGNIYTAD